MSDNLKMLQAIARGLEELKDEVVFVGGAVAELYATDPAASEIRPTKDVDCVIELGTRSDYANLEEKLRTKGFRHDSSTGAPICRKVYQGIIVDIMPTDSDIIGFSNRWYSEGIQNRITKRLPNGSDIFVFSPVYYLAAKFEAHNDRGGSDLRQSHDFEDIIYILGNCTKIYEDILSANGVVREYLVETVNIFLENVNLTEGIESALPFGSDSDTTENIELLLKSISEINVE